MENEVSVSCHAPSFSLLLFETVRSAHDQKGLLIGEVCKDVISERTDENEMNREERTTIYLEHCIPIKDDDFFGNAGTINKQKLLKFIDNYENKVVGWYSFRRNTRVTSRTLREVLIHQSLLESVPNVKPEYFIAAFMSANIGANYSTHTYNHVFTRYHLRNAMFEPLKFKIYTISDKIVEANGYSERDPFPTSDTFENIINSTQKERSPVSSVLAMNEKIQDYLRTVNKKLIEAENNRYQLEEKVKNLRKMLSPDTLQDIKFIETEKELPVLRVKCLQYNPQLNYNPNRKENPIRLAQTTSKPEVPDEREVQTVKSEFEKNRSQASHSLSRKRRGKKNAASNSNDIGDSSANSFEQKRCNNALENRDGSKLDSESKSDKNEKPMEDLEEAKVAS